MKKVIGWTMFGLLAATFQAALLFVGICRGQWEVLAFEGLVAYIFAAGYFIS